MINHTQPHQQAIELLLQHWSKYTKLKKSHSAWVLDNSTYHNLANRRVLYKEGSKDKLVYIVCDGMIARIYYDEKTEKNKIFSIALPGMAMMTTEHLYSDSPSQGNIVSIRPSHILALPYDTILKRKKKDMCMETLIDVLNSKKKKQLVQLRRLSLIENASERYLCFCKQMPLLKAILSQREIAMLLNISRSTIQRTNRRLP